MALSTLEQEKYFEPHYSTKFFRAYRNYLNNNYGGKIFEQVCDELGVPAVYLLSDFNWISHDFYFLFLGRIKELTGDEHINYKLGKALLHPSNINPFELILLKLLPAFLYFSLLPKFTKKLNRLSRYKLISLRPGLLRLELISNGQIQHNLEVCENVIGMAEGAAEPLGLDSVTVKHERCIHRGETQCIFEIRYSGKGRWIRRAAVLLTLAASSLLIHLTLNRMGVINFSIQVLSQTTILFCSVSIYLLWKFYLLLKHHNVNTEQALLKDSELYSKRTQLFFKNNETEMLAELAVTLNQGLTPNEILEKALAELKVRFGYATGIVMLLDSASGILSTHSAIGLDENSDLKSIYKFSVNYGKEKSIGKNYFATILDNSKIQLIPNMNELSNDLGVEENNLLRSLAINSLIIAPIRSEEAKFGLLIIGRPVGSKPLTEQDATLVKKILQLLTLAFRNSIQLENEKQLKNLFKKYVPAIVLDSVSSDAATANAFSPKQMQIASIFVDLRDFTKTSENMEPFRVRQMLTEYVSYVTRIIAEAGGVIDKITGDGVNAFFLKHSDQDNPSFQAVSAGLQLLDQAYQLRKVFDEKGFKPPRFGVGVNSGPAIVGAFGSEYKMEYAALGDTVNTASRLQTLCKEISAENGIVEQSMFVCSTQSFKESKLTNANYSAKTISVRGRIQQLEVIYFLEEKHAFTRD